MLDGLTKMVPVHWWRIVYPIAHHQEHLFGSLQRLRRCLLADQVVLPNVRFHQLTPMLLALLSNQLLTLKHYQVDDGSCLVRVPLPQVANDGSE